MCNLYAHLFNFNCYSYFWSLFLQEVNEVVQKVSGADQPVPIWTDDGISVVAKDTSKHMLYSLIFRLKVGSFRNMFTRLLR